MTLRLATEGGNPSLTLTDILSEMLYESNHIALNRGLLMSCVETAIELRGRISDAAVLDIIQIALQRAKADEADRKVGK